MRSFRLQDLQALSYYFMSLPPCIRVDCFQHLIPWIVTSQLSGSAAVAAALKYRDYTIEDRVINYSNPYRKSFLGLWMWVFGFPRRRAESFGVGFMFFDHGTG